MSKALAETLIKRHANKRALCLVWNDGKAKVSIIGYESWMWRDDLIAIMGKAFVLQLDRAATKLLGVGRCTAQPKDRR